MSIMKLPRAVVDFEGRSRVDLKAAGAWRYSEDSSTEILCLGWRLTDTGEEGLWVPGTPFPHQIADAISSKTHVFEAHNAQFERAMWINVLTPLTGVPVPSMWVDTMAVCAYRGIPLKLETAGAALRLPVQKDARGSYLISRLCKPKKPSKKDPSEWDNDPELMAELYDYCSQDVRSEEALGEALGDLPPSEHRIWVLDQTINQRGMHLDIDAVKSAIAIRDEYSAVLLKDLNVVTNGEVTTGNQVARILNFVQDRGVSILDVTADSVKNALADHPDMDPVARRVLEIRQELGKSSVSKLDTMLASVCTDGRVRGMMQYHGAQTGRWAGRLVQPHNFPRGSVKDMDALIDTIRMESHEILQAEYGSVMEPLASSLRGMFDASPGTRFNVADFSAIEARVVMWLAGQDDAMSAFRKADRGEGPDIYCVMAEKMYGRPITKDKDPEARTLGKITILGCGYQMGPDKLIYQAYKDYGVVLDQETARMMVGTFREDYDMVPKLWYGLQEAAINALTTGRPHGYRYITYAKVEDAAGTWLRCTLPNGKNIWYYDPRVEWVDTPWGRRQQIQYMGRNSKHGGRWELISTYGGMMAENATQSVAREIMTESMIRVEKNGYPVVLTVHDEVVAETPENHGSQREFEELMTLVSSWAKGLPVGVEGWEGYRYRKG